MFTLWFASIVLYLSLVHGKSLNSFKCSYTSANLDMVGKYEDEKSYWQIKREAHASAAHHFEGLQVYHAYNTARNAASNDDSANRDVDIFDSATSSESDTMEICSEGDDASPATNMSMLYSMPVSDKVGGCAASEEGTNIKD